MSILNIQLCTTAGESPFRNGLSERVHTITDMMLVKLAADYGNVNSQNHCFHGRIWLEIPCKCGTAIAATS